MSRRTDDSEDSDSVGTEEDAADGLSKSNLTDSDEEIDGMDIAECDRRHYECLELLTDLKRQFVVLREQLYRERIREIREKMQEIQEGIANEYITPLQQLQAKTKFSLEMAEIRRKLCKKSIQVKYKAEKRAARQDFENRKSLLFESMRERLLSKINRIERNIQRMHTYKRLTKSLLSGTVIKELGASENTNSDSSETSFAEPTEVSGPYIVYRLHEDEIFDDWATIKTSLYEKMESEEVSGSQK